MLLDYLHSTPESYGYPSLPTEKQKISFIPLSNTNVISASKELDSYKQLPFIHRNFDHNEKQKKWITKSFFPLTYSLKKKKNKTYLQNNEPEYKIKYNPTTVITVTELMPITSLKTVTHRLPKWGSRLLSTTLVLLFWTGCELTRSNNFAET